MKITNIALNIWVKISFLQLYADTTHVKEAPLNNCWGFIDETVHPICRLHEIQRVVYNRHKRVHIIKFQSLVTPNGPAEGCRHE